MRNLLGSTLAMLLSLAAPSIAAAQSPFLGLRVGYAIPFGDVGGGYSVRDQIASDIPLQLDAGFRLGRPVDVSVYFSYGFGQVASSANAICGSGDCSTNVIRLGAQGAIHSEVRPGREVWAGILGGWERLAFNAPSPQDLTTSGWEFGVQGGFDFASPSTGFGPFASLTVGEFSDLTVGGTDVSLSEKKIHSTFQVGVRGCFNL